MVFFSFKKKIKYKNFLKLTYSKHIYLKTSFNFFLFIFDKRLLFIKSILLYLNKYYYNNNLLFFSNYKVISLTTPLYKKPFGARMGKGKGKLIFFFKKLLIGDFFLRFSFFGNLFLLFNYFKSNNIFFRFFYLKLKFLFFLKKS